MNLKLYLAIFNIMLYVVYSCIGVSENLSWWVLFELIIITNFIDTNNNMSLNIVSVLF